MSPLEIDTATPFYTVMENKQPIYSANIVPSPISIDDESRRSSHCSYNDRHKSLPSNQYEILYPTKKSAYDRIDYLEEKIKYQKDMNETVIQQMNQSIDDFLASREPITVNDMGTSSMQPIPLQLFIDFTQIVFNPHYEKSKMIEFIESNSFSVTDDKMTKQDFQNVLIDTIDTEKQRYSDEISDRQRKEFEQTSLVQEQEKRELEQVLDEMQREMESMINELDQLKQIDGMGEGSLKELLIESAETVRTMELSNMELKRSLTKVKTTFEQQVEALQHEKEELRGRLVKAERAATNHHQKLQENTELEKVLQRAVAQKEAETAKVTYDLDKLQKQHKQLQEINEKRVQHEVKARLEDLESTLKSRYQKEQDLFELQRSRETRQLAGHITELELEIEIADRQHKQDMQLMDHIKKQYDTKTQQIQQREIVWEKKETELKHTILSYDQKIISLEKEVLVLYSKNLGLVESLGELEV